ncbi:Uncharacterised protein [uncultured archaeon]|nr:Uncharacterised protein [uncultured archaeon]
MSVTRGLPSVIVPVLSKMTAFILCICSSASASFIRMPFCAPMPVPTMIAVGVASPNAQGQAITSTETANISESAKGCAAAKYQKPNVASESSITTGTK